MENHKYTSLYYLSISLFFINLLLLIGGILGLPFAIGYESTPILMIFAYLAFLLFLFINIILFSLVTVRIFKNKNVSEKLLLTTFIILLLTIVIFATGSLTNNF
jgi:hypothetical protein